MKKLIVSALLLTPAAFAGEVVGNGGDVIVCPGQSPQVLDIYEAVHVHGMRLRQPVGATAEEIAKGMLSEVERLNPARAKVLRSRIDRFRSEMSLVPNAALVDIPDTNHIVIPKNCVLNQIAIQKREKVLPQDPLYVVDKELWAAMDITNQAALILHEVLYTDAIAYRHANSIPTRYMNGLVHSDRLAALTPKQFHKFIEEKAGLGVMVELGHKNWVAFRYFLYKDKPWDYLKDRVKLTCSFYGMAPAHAGEVRPHAKTFYRKLFDIYGRTPDADEIEGKIYGLMKGSNEKSNAGVFYSNGKSFYEEVDSPTARAQFTVCKPIR